MAWTGIENLEEGLRAQRAFLDGKVPSYARVLDVVLEETALVEARLEPLWRGRRFDAWYERPLLLLAALRHDALVVGPAHPLYASIVEEPARLDTLTRGAVVESLGSEGVAQTLAERFVQTNETSRAVAWLWVATLLEGATPGRDWALVDLGCSAGLNLVADKLPSPWRDESGGAVPTRPIPRIVERLGIDRRPLDALDPDVRSWLLACVWPGERERHERLAAALGAFEALSRAGEGPALEALSLAEAPARIAAVRDDVSVLAVQTIVRDYLTEEVLARYVDGMRAWLEGRAPTRAYWVELELVRPADTAEAERMAAISVHFRPSSGTIRTLTLARTGPHPRVLAIQPDALAALAALAADAREGA
jgi:hypothetical protein